MKIEMNKPKIVEDEVQLAPSVLAADFARLGEQVAQAEEAGASRIHVRTFGMSAPMKIVAEHFGFTPDHVATVAKEVLARCRTTQNG